jgi:hypothetical protein
VPVDPRHLRIAQIVLSAVGDRYQVAVGGGNSLMLHGGFGDRFTEDLDLFVRRARQAAAAARDGVAALEAAGYKVSVTAEGDDLVQLLVHPPDEAAGKGVKVDFAYFTFGDPVQTEAGPTVPVEDQIRNKVSGLFMRQAVRDYIDLAHILASGRYTLPELIEMALEIDNLGGPEAIVDAAQHLARHIGNRRIERYLTADGEDGPWVRRVLSVLPSTPEEVLDLMGWDKWPDHPEWKEDNELEWP